MLKKVAGFPKSLAERGILSIEHPELAAEQLFVSWLGLSQLRQNLGLAGPPSTGAIARRVRYATDTNGTRAVVGFSGRRQCGRSAQEKPQPAGCGPQCEKGPAALAARLQFKLKGNELPPSHSTPCRSKGS